jgi:alanine racemase
MGIVEDEGLIKASEEDITITVSNFDQIETLKKLKKNLTIHLNVDTGMNRLGCKNDHTILEAVRILKENPKVFIQGIYTHFSTADDNKIYYDIQMRRFRQILEMIDYHFEMIHISNSSSTIKYEADIDFTTHARVGISLYGLTLDPGNDFLKNTFSLYTYVSQIKTLNIGEKVGYGAVYTAKQSEILGVLPIGYADGFIRLNQGGEVEINKERYPIVGRICMDQMFVRLDENVKKTDRVTLFGGQITIDEVADRLETINYEIICQIGSRVPRQYIK